MITVDTNPHEEALYIHLQEIASRPTSNFEVQRGRLDVGDVEIRADPSDASSETIWLERKTWGDWVSSITDGRYRDQKKRALHATDTNTCARFVYALEGAGVERWNGSTRKMRNVMPIAALVKTLLRDGVPVLRTNCIEDTAELAAYLCKQLSTGELNAQARIKAVEKRTNGVFKRKRTSDMQPESLFKTMISSVPGMGGQKADAVYKQFHTIHILAEACKHDLDAIADVRVGSKRLGHNTAAALRSALIG
jgi:ERCC4-type nuclease